MPRRNNFVGEEIHDRASTAKGKNEGKEDKKKATTGDNFYEDERSRESDKKVPEKDIKNHSKKYEIPEKPKV